MHPIWKVRKSNIHGLGVFANVNIKPNVIIEKMLTMHSPASAFFSINPLHDVRVLNERYVFDITPFGSRVNHQASPIANTKLFMIDGSYWLLSIKPIRIGEELTIDYDRLPPFLGRSQPDYK